jgi:hypothetical protein
VLVSLPVGLRLDLRFGHFHHTRPSPITFPPIPKGRGTVYIEEVRMRNTRTLTADWRLLSHDESSALAIGLLPHDESLVIDPVYRPQIKATKHDDGSVIVRAGRSWVQFSAADLHELYAFAADRPTIQKYPSMALRPHTATNNTAVGE